MDCCSAGPACSDRIRQSVVYLERFLGQTAATSRCTGFAECNRWISSVNDLSHPAESVILMRHTSGAWQQLPTTYLREDESYCYYQALTAGTSTFAVIGSHVVDIPETPEGEPFPWIFVIIGVIAAIILVIAFLFKTGFFYLEDKEIEEKEKGQDDDGGETSFPNLGEECKAVHPRHSDVAENHIEIGSDQLGQRSLTVRRRVGPVTLFLQPAGRGCADSFCRAVSQSRPRL